MHRDPDDREDRPDLEIDVVTCAQCGHPNLEVRSHCRRCGVRLLGSANLVPGVELLEWAPTDGANRRHARGLPPRMLAFVIGVLLLPVVLLRFREVIHQHPFASALAAAFVVVGLVLLAWSRRRLPEPGGSDAEDETPPATHATGNFPLGEPCPECGARTFAIDDVCVECGAVVASDFRT